VITGLGSASVTSDDSGSYSVNLANIGDWSVGNSVVLAAYKKNVGLDTKTVVSDSSPAQTQNFILSQDDKYEVYTPESYLRLDKAILADYEGKNYGFHYPLPVQGTDSDIDLIRNPQREWTITRADGQADSETVTFADGTQYRRTFTYSGGSPDVLIRRSRWEKL